MQMVYFIYMIKHDNLLKNKEEFKLFTSEKAALYLGIKKDSLSVWRCTKRYKIPYIKVGRLVRYRKSDLDSWLESRTYI